MPQSYPAFRSNAINFHTESIKQQALPFSPILGSRESMAESPEISALRNLILEVHTIVATTELPEWRGRRAVEVLAAAILLVDDLNNSKPAAALGKKGGEKTKEHFEKKREEKSRALDDAIANANFGEPPTTAQVMTYMGLDPKEEKDRHKFDRIFKPSKNRYERTRDEDTNLYTFKPKGIF